MAEKKKKKKSKLKKILGALGKVAMLGAAGYGASKLFGGRKKKLYGRDAGFLTSGAAGGPYGPTPFHPAQGNLSKWEKMARKQTDPILHGGVGVKPARIDAYDTVSIPKHHQQMQWGGKKGGRVTGIAKRGFGRALMKGKK